MNEKELDMRIEQANNKMLPEVDGIPEEVLVTEEQTTQVDVFQDQRRNQTSTKPVQYRGARPSMRIDFSMIEDGTLPVQYKKAKEDSDYYTSIGDKNRASIIKQQYMQDYFLPAVDALVRMNSMEAVLANKDILSALDAYTLLEGTRGAGYTKSYVSSMYAPTGQIERTDAEVERAIHRIRALCEDDMIRAAIGEAKQIKRAIDEGKNIATTEDYELITRVALA